MKPTIKVKSHLIQELFYAVRFYIRLSTFTHAAANKGIGNESVPKIIINDTIIFFS